MRHGNSRRKLNRSAAHRKALLRNLVTALVLKSRIETTLPKAKELKRVADKLVTLGKRNTLHTRRQAMSVLYAINRQEEGNAKKLTALHKLFTEIAPRFATRNGGYTRVVRSRKRVGDCAQLAIVEFVEGGEVAAKKETRKRRAVKRTEEAPAAAAE